MDLRSLNLPEVKLLTPRRSDDERGWFSETYNSKTLSNLGLDLTFIQDNQSLTYETGVIRGMHFQDPPHAQTKLLRVLRGRIFDVVVDIRKGSPRFGQFVVIELSGEDGSAILVPEGFGGRDGIFRFSSQGHTNRGLSIYQVEERGVKVIEKAPSSFKNPTN